MEQLINWRLYTNHIVTLGVLVMLTGMFAVISLLPLVGLWFQISALVTGALLTPCLLRHHVIYLPSLLSSAMLMTHSWHGSGASVIN